MVRLAHAPPTVSTMTEGDIHRLLRFGKVSQTELASRIEDIREILALDAVTAKELVDYLIDATCHGYSFDAALRRLL